jgi:hypothetical protein
MDPVVISLGILFLLSLRGKGATPSTQPTGGSGGGGGGGGAAVGGGSGNPTWGQGVVTQGPPDTRPGTVTPTGGLSFGLPIGMTSPDPYPTVGPYPPRDDMGGPPPPTPPPSTPRSIPTPSAPMPPTQTPATPMQPAQTPAAPVPSIPPSVSPPAGVIDVGWWERPGLPDYCGRSWVPLLASPCQAGRMEPLPRRGPPPVGIAVVTGPVPGASRAMGSPQCPTGLIWYLVAGSQEWDALCPRPVEK